MVGRTSLAGSAVQSPSAGVLEARRRLGPDHYLRAIGVIGILAVWLRPLGSSLWLDETGTLWVIQGSLGSVLERGLDFQGQFPLYHVFLWGWSKLAGTSELALRLPSLAAALLATWLCYRLALRLFNEILIARLAACTFVLVHPVAFAAADARPYALALASLLGATLALVRWLQSQRLRDGIAYAGLTALTLYFHYLFALALIAHAFLAFGPIRRLGRRGAAAAAVAALAVSALLVPAIPHAVQVFGRRRAMSLPTFGSMSHLLAWLAPPMIVVSLLAGRLVRLTDDEPPRGKGKVREDLLPFLGTWFVLPPLALYVAGSVSGVGLFAERHFLSSAPALALLAATVLALLSFRRQRIALVVMAMLFVLTYSSPMHVPSDWRGAARAADALSAGPDTPVFVYSGFSESSQLEWILDEERSRLFLAPLAAYPVEGRLHPLPFELTDRGREYAGAILSAEAPGAERILLITSESAMTYDTWLSDQASLVGFTPRDVGVFGDVRVLVFER